MDRATGWCKGCYRTIDEIIVWSQADDAAKQAIWQQLHIRHRQARFPEAALHSAFEETP